MSRDISLVVLEKNCPKIIVSNLYSKNFNITATTLYLLLTRTNVPVRLVPSPLLSASSSINSEIDFLTALISTTVLVAASALTILTCCACAPSEEYDDRASNAPEAAAGAAYRVPNRVAAVNIVCR